jgi:expansin (peptidoglycan-binding protein)
VADGGTDAGATDVPCDGGTAESGAATFYEPASATACGLPAEGDYVALPPGLFAGSRGCGACIEVTGPRGVRVARAVDLCAGCAPDELDLARATFAALEAPEQGRISVTYRFVPCEVSGPVSYRVAEGSDPSRLALQVRDHRYAVASLELRPSGGSAFTPLERTQDNLFVHPSASGPLALPATLRVTDVHGHVLTDTLDSVEPGRTVAGAAQFPATCGP